MTDFHGVENVIYIIIYMLHIVYIIYVKIVASFWGLGQLMGVAHK